MDGTETAPLFHLIYQVEIRQRQLPSKPISDPLTGAEAQKSHMIMAIAWWSAAISGATAPTSITKAEEDVRGDRDFAVHLDYAYSNSNRVRQFGAKCAVASAPPRP